MKYAMSFHLFKPTFCFSRMFSSYRSGIFLKFILKYFIFLMLVETETFLPPCSQTNYYVYTESIGFCLLILLNSFCLGILLLLILLAFQHTLTHHLYTEIAFPLPFLLMLLIIFSWLNMVIDFVNTVQCYTAMAMVISIFCLWF